MRNQTATLSAWVRADGAGPNNDATGNALIYKEINRPSGIQSAYALSWSALNNKFSFVVESAQPQ